MRKPIIVSSAGHAVLVLALFLAFRASVAPVADQAVHEVEILASLPPSCVEAARAVPSPPGGDHAAEGGSPQPSPAVAGQEEQDLGSDGGMSDSGNAAAQGEGDQAAGQQSVAGRSPAHAAMWKNRVIASVNSFRESSGDEVGPGSSIQLTYRIRVGRTGEILKEDLLQSSGSESFDRSIAAALGRIAVLPPPPPLLIAENEYVEVRITFSASSDETGRIIRFGTTASAD